MKVWDLDWPIEVDADGVPHRLDAPVLVTLDQEGYAAFVELKARAAAVVGIPEARDVFIADMDMLVRFYLEFPGADAKLGVRMLSATERFARFSEPA